MRLAVTKLTPDLYKAMDAFDNALGNISLEQPLVELVKLRASQLNGCAYCVNMHSADARKGGETEQRIYLLPVWREVSLFTDRERSAFEVTEGATKLTEGGISDEVWQRATAHFTEVELAELIWVITVINAWNRIGAVARPWPV